MPNTATRTNGITWPGHGAVWNLTELYPHRRHREGSLQFGIELEIGTGTDDPGSGPSRRSTSREVFRRLRDRAITKDDCTCSGVEINLAPMGFRNVQRALDSLLSEPLPHTHERDTYGMHIHVSTERIADRTIDRALDFMGANPRFMVFVANRDNAWSRVILRNVPAGYDLRRRVEYKTDGSGVYVHTVHGTHEFRMFRTTRSAHMAKANVQFIMALLRFCRSTPSTEVERFTEYVRLSSESYHNFAQRISEEWDG